MEKSTENQHHFVLVHGACHGAWSWYKVTNLLKSAGHQVTAIDLAASGIRQEKLSEIPTFVDYSQPLIEFMDSLPTKEKVILVGHSFGGMCLALAMEKYPEKVAVAVFATAFMPDSSNRPSYVLDEYFGRTPMEIFVDTEFNFNKVPATMFFGPKCLSLNLYQASPLEDYTLATTLIRESSLFMDDLSKSPTFSKEGYGSVHRVYLVCDEDKVIGEHFQRWMIENYPAKEVKVIKGSDHMPMFSRPQEFFNSLLEISNTYN